MRTYLNSLRRKALLEFEKMRKSGDTKEFIIPLSLKKVPAVVSATTSSPYSS